ncbi:MAG: hydrogenase formation protein HypD [Candidatus Zixiibacteriota bacterium]
MKYIDEYRDPKAATKIVEEIKRTISRPWTIMEVCGGQTHAIVKHGLDRLLPDKITLLHGPGCPVCVTPVDMIDKALDLASRDDVIFCSFGDMLRVPGTGRDLLTVRAEGGDMRTVYSPLDALDIAVDNPDKKVVFFGIGFETTAPANALAVIRAKNMALTNFSFLCAQVLIPPAMEIILNDAACRVNGFLAAGHVCTVVGYAGYEPLANKYKIPITVTGFEPLDILLGILMTVRQLEQGRTEVENQYTRAVKKEGNLQAREIMNRVFRTVDRRWRGLGVIPSSGLGLRDEFAAFDAEKKFGLPEKPVPDDPECISGLVLQGRKKPSQCPAFGERCTPENPLGATMVSSEGACAAYYRYRREEILNRSQE